MMTMVVAIIIRQGWTRVEDYRHHDHRQICGVEVIIEIPHVAKPLDTTFVCEQNWLILCASSRHASGFTMSELSYTHLLAAASTDFIVLSLCDDDPHPHHRSLVI